jgi:hypothetical protein
MSTAVDHRRLSAVSIRTLVDAPPLLFVSDG